MRLLPPLGRLLCGCGGLTRGAALPPSCRHVATATGSVSTKIGGGGGGGDNNSNGTDGGDSDGGGLVPSCNSHGHEALVDTGTSSSAAATTNDATAASHHDGVAAVHYASLSTAQGGMPSIVSSGSHVMSESRLDELATQEEERRVARQKKLFEDLIVFEGGALADHDSLGTSLIMRDFIHFALYHKKWGYYPKLHRKYRQLMTSGYFDPVPFASLRNQHDYELYVGKIHESTPACITPTQLFQPHYGWVLAEYLVTMMRAKFDPREPLVVYDIGAGTGALAVSVLDYLAEHFSAVYAQCEYHVVEQNPQLVQVLRNRLITHYHHVKIHNISILNWRQLERRRCVLLGVELLSGMPHDCVLLSGDGVCNEHWFGFQQHDNLSTVHERYYALKDPVILRYLRYLRWLQEESFHSLKVLCLTGGRENIDPPPFTSIEPNMNDPLRVIMTKVIWTHSPFRTLWLPTVAMLFLETCAAFFPRHHLFLVDWSGVRQALPGVNGPVCQCKVRVAKDMYLRRPADSLHGNAGMVDICFPTDFEHLAVVYRNICGAHKDISSLTHPQFWKTFGGDKTALFTTRSGFNPLLEDFEPFHVFATHHPPEM
ncbi:putative S-adenosyl-L-methionine-dependent methyltransferase [Trypanosoma cruzi]|nr:putative S-adenosyl-L-methionine-dependent methyltransferase [Trypanosoma cruzi]